MIRKNNDYTICNISGVPYLLPFGQNVADLRRGFCLNETGIFIWNALDDYKEKEALVQAFASHFAIDVETADEDVSLFLDQLQKQGVVFLPVTERKEELFQKLQIGRLVVALYGKKEYFEREEYVPFFTDEDNTEDFFFEVNEYRPSSLLHTENLLRNGELCIEETENVFILKYPGQPLIYEVRLKKDGSGAVAYVAEDKAEVLCESLFYSLRTCYLYCSSLHGMFALHSASLLYKDKAWLFSAPSGTGKSTHVNLWKKLYDVQDINGDINLLAMDQDSVVVYGMPWCGTSGIYTDRTYPLGGVILLARDIQPHVQELPEDQKQLLVAQRMISPVWKKEMLERNIHFAGMVKDRAMVCRLFCNTDTTSAKTMKEYIDQNGY